MSRSLPTYLVGRSARADIVLPDPTVSRLHAELVRSKDGKWFLTDRRSTGGTFLGYADGSWEPLRQDFVSPSDRLRLGAFECRVDDLLRQLPGGQGGDGSGTSTGPGGEGVRASDDRIAGPVLRDPDTGEIVPGEER